MELGPFGILYDIYTCKLHKGATNSYLVSLYILIRIGIKTKKNAIQSSLVILSILVRISIWIVPSPSRFGLQDRSLLGSHVNYYAKFSLLILYRSIYIIWHCDFLVNYQLRELFIYYFIGPKENPSLISIAYL